MTVPKINSAHGSDTRNIINRAIETLNRLGIDVQTLVAEGQLTPSQYAELITLINGLVKSGHVDKSDLTPEFKGEIEGISAQLAQKADDSEVVKKGYGTLSDFDETTRAQIQGLEPGQINAVLGEGNVTPYNTSGIFELKHINLVDKSKLVLGTIDQTNGDITTGYGANVSDFIEVVEGKTYRTNGHYNSGFYDANKQFIQGFANSSTVNVPTGLNIKYVRVAFSPANSEIPMLVEGSVLPENYIPYEQKEIIGFSSEVKTAVEKVVDSKPVVPESISFFEAKRINLVDPSKLVIGAVDQTTGEITTGYGARTSGFIEVEEGKTYRTNGTWNSGYYDENKIFVEGFTGSTIINIPTGMGIKYIRVAFSGSIYPTAMVVKGETLPESFIPYDEMDYSINDTKVIKSINEIVTDVNDPLKGKKVNFLGDSITEGYGYKPYHQFIAERTGIINNNYGVSGSHIAVTDDRDYSFVERYESMTDDADMVIIFGGTNDYANGVPYGTMESRDNDTFYGACHLLFEGLTEKYVGKPIGVVLPLQRTGKRLKELVDIEREVASFYSMPVLDLYNHGGIATENTIVQQTLIPDKVHPNTKGQEYISHKIEAFMKTL